MASGFDRITGAQIHFNPAQSSDCLRELWRLDPSESISVRLLFGRLKASEKLVPVMARLWPGMAYTTFKRCLQVWADVGWIISPPIGHIPQGFTRRAVMLTAAGRKRWNNPAVTGLRHGKLPANFLETPLNNHLRN